MLNVKCKSADCPHGEDDGNGLHRSDSHAEVRNFYILH